jgi:branched-chain amino acid transport system permease protein
MAFLLLFEHLAVIYWGSELRTVPALFANADWRIAGLVISLPQLAGLVASIALIWALTLVLAGTRLGRGLRTIAEDSDTALLLGVEINRIVPVVFLISVWGSIAGGLIIGLVEVMSIGYFGADFVDIAIYGLLLLILFVRPTGLFAAAFAGQRA